MERISIELTDYCFKGCSFCYNGSNAKGNRFWLEPELVSFVQDCAANGLKAVSFGGGEPLQHPDIFSILTKLQGKLFRSLTTNGLLLEQNLPQLVKAKPDKVHVSVHFPDDPVEVSRVIEQVHQLQSAGIKSGINLLVARSWLEAARQAASRIRESGIGNERIVYLPMRHADTPSPQEIAVVAGGANFQSMTCLAACRKSERFCSVAVDQTVAWCSYTSARRKLVALDFAGLMAALQDLDLTFCGGIDGN